jgi:acetyl esterase/lipase
LGAVVASVEYRVAPEFPYPIPMEDCYSGLEWFFAKADEFGVDPNRIALGGASAGGGLAAGLALLARDRRRVKPCFQLLTYPMLDDRNVSPSSHGITDTRVWNRAANQAGWDAYLAGDAGAADVPVYAAPSRCTDLGGLPPAIVTVGNLDMFLDEDIAYAQALLQAGVPTELHVYPGAFHGSNIFVAHSDLSQRWKRDELGALERALNA